MMTVKELRELLAKFEDDDEIDVRGGEGDCGEWAELGVWHGDRYSTVVSY